jgi:purine-nucleoside phosphorylase
MLLTEEEEIEFRRKKGLEDIGKYDGVAFGMGVTLFDETEEPNMDYLDDLSVIYRKGKNILFDGRKNGKRILYPTMAAGAPAASSIFDTFLCHGYTDKAIGIGYIGATQKNLSVGDVIIPDEAIPGDGATPYYFPEDPNFGDSPPAVKKGYQAKPSPVLLDKLIEETQREKISFHKGRIFTTSCYTMETPEFIERLNKKGVLGFDMETSCLFSEAQFHNKNKEAAAILVVTDNQLTNHNYTLDNFFEGREIASKKLQKAIKIATNTLLRI